MPSSVFTSQLTSNAALAFARSLQTGNTTFLTVGNPYQPNTLDNVSDTSQEIAQAFAEQLGGVKITAADVAIACKRVDWVTGKAFDAYSAYKRTDCFVTTNVAGTLRVYKCLNNNGGAVSTVQPTGVVAASFKTTDGYVWKFMWEVASATATKFATANTVPIVVNANTTAAAVPSSIDSITLDDTGRGYAHYFSGSVQATDLDSATTIRLGSLASSVTSFYSQAVIEVTNPSSISYGEVRIVTAYDGGSKTITLDRPFTGIQVNDSYSIRPQVIITGSATGNSAIASASINVNSNTVQSIIIHKAGSDYINPSANVYAHGSVGVLRQAAVTPHVSPIKGHGGDVVSEANGSFVTISKSIANTSAATLGVKAFATVALVASPLFTDVVVTGTAGQMAKFIPGESVVGYRRRGGSIGTVNAAASVMTGTNTAFTSMIGNADTVAVANATTISFVTVTSVTNATSAVITNSTPISGAASAAQVVSLGQVKVANSTTVVLTNVPAAINHPITSLAGLTSKISADITTLVYPFASDQVFASTADITGSVVGTFTAGEVVASGNSLGTVVGTATGHAYVMTAKPLTSNTVYTGQTSGATITPTSIRQPTIVKNSGQMLYINNNLPINIASNRTINVTVTISF
jgi:hypothetical protein